MTGTPNTSRKDSSQPTKAGDQPQLFSKSTVAFSPLQMPEVKLPQGGGSIQGVEEKFSVNPTTLHTDSLGRVVLSLAHAGFDNNNEAILLETYIDLDIEGNTKGIRDARGNSVEQYYFGYYGESLSQSSMDSGTRTALYSIDGQVLYSYDEQKRLRLELDVLRRPTANWLMEDYANNSPEKKVGLLIYGESALNPEENNLRGQLWKAYEQDGQNIAQSFDFKGNLLQGEKRYTQSYQGVIDYNCYAPNSDHIDYQISDRMIFTNSAGFSN
jgi:hypothetical protein